MLVSFSRDLSMWRYPKILAHRGGGALAPENTLAGVRCGMQHGFRAVEFDAMLARDGVPVVMHDPSLGRTVAGYGKVSDYDAAELAAMDAGSWFSRQFAGEPVPLFVDFVRFCRANGVWMNIEIKPAPGFDRETGGTVARLTAELFADDIAAGAWERVPLLSSFSQPALEAAHEAAPLLPLACLMSKLEAGWEQRAGELDAVSIHLDHKHLTPELARQVKAAGFGLFCYTVNDPQRARQLLGWGVDAFCTDRIDLIGPDFA
jgi:glycerophosphoryl diester phosphodiesterase